MAERRAQLNEFLVMNRNNRDFDGTQLGSRRNREMYLSARVRC
ncbi:MAG TPA: hypothetical protein VFE61_18890 [Candidatus Sulfotelmatobacter sp.]|jgi:hypothetical protein|nr:hypothetical protein [Candidatus Sulfotelmatobacter sp.]